MHLSGIWGQLQMRVTDVQKQSENCFNCLCLCLCHHQLQMQVTEAITGQKKQSANYFQHLGRAEIIQGRDNSEGKKLLKTVKKKGCNVQGGR